MASNSTRSPYYCGDVVGKKVAAFESGKFTISTVAADVESNPTQQITSPTHPQQDMVNGGSHHLVMSPQPGTSGENTTSPTNSSSSASATRSSPAASSHLNQSAITNGIGPNFNQGNSQQGLMSPISSSSSSASHNQPIYGFHREPQLPASFENPLLNIEPDTRSAPVTSQETNSERGVRSGHYRKAPNLKSGPGGGLGGPAAVGGAKQGIYQKSISMISNGMSPLLRKKQQQISQVNQVQQSQNMQHNSQHQPPFNQHQQQHQQQSQTQQQQFAHGPSMVKSPVERQRTLPGSLHQPTSPNDQLMNSQQQPQISGSGGGGDDSDSSQARNRRKSEPVMFSLESINSEIARIHQRQEQIMENMTIQDFDAIVALAAQQQENAANNISMNQHLNNVMNQNVPRPSIQHGAAAAVSQPSTHPGGPMAMSAAIAASANSLNMNPYGLSSYTNMSNSSSGAAAAASTTNGANSNYDLMRRVKVASLGRGEQLQSQSPASSSHYNSGGSKEPLYMLYDHESSHRSNSRNDDQNIYEEIDFMNSLRAQYGSTHYGTHHHHTLGGGIGVGVGGNSESLSLNSWKKKAAHGSKRSLAPSSFTRWFSTRKKSSPSSTLTTEIDLENPYTMDGLAAKFHPATTAAQQHQAAAAVAAQQQAAQQHHKKQRPPISLPDPPSQLTPEKLKRRYIIGSIVESENTYISALQRLINDYKKPLEETSPSILSQNKINTIFYRIEQLLQCHTIFGIALSQCVREWDEKERIGEVFIVSFSKPMVLDIYSDFINNFTAAMEIARKASKSKSQFAHFLSERLLASHDRLSFFGLMVKPVQRFPQFILLLTDLLKHTPADHHDRMSLQLALTQLESLADRLNERKRDAERHFAVKQLLKDYLSNSAANNAQRYLIRQDDIYVVELDPNTGLVQKTKCRKLYLLNDMLICVALPSNKLKFAVSLQEVDVMEDVTPAINATANSKDNSSSPVPAAGASGTSGPLATASVEKMYIELTNLMHDLEVMSRITQMLASLRYQYNGLTPDIPEGIAVQIREEIRRKDAQLTLIDKSCFQLRIRSKSYKDVLIVQMSDAELKRDFHTDVRLAKLALDRANNPAWDSILDNYPSPTNPTQNGGSGGLIAPRVPLFVKSLPIFATIDNSQLTCALFYRIYHGPLLESETGVLWICNVSEKGSQLGALATTNSDLSLIHSYELCDSHVTCLESVGSLTVWIGLRQGRIIVINANSPGEWQQYAALDVASEVTCMRHFGQHVYVGLIGGIVSIFDAVSFHEPIVIELAHSPVTCLLPVNDEMYACCANKIWVINGTEMERSYSLVQSTPSPAGGGISGEEEELIDSVGIESDLCPNLLAQSGIGLWVSLVKSPVIKLFHTETFKHLQDINVAVNVRRALNEPSAEVYITSLLATRGLLWVGTNVGIIVTLALPRLQGVPLISGSISVSLHRHLGPVNILLSLTPGADCIPHIPQNLTQKAAIQEGGRNSAVAQALSDQKSQLEDMESIYGLYSDLMNVGDYMGVKRSAQNAAMQRMAYDLSNMNISDDSTSESASSGAIYATQSLTGNNPRMTRPLHPHPAPGVDPTLVQKPPTGQAAPQSSQQAQADELERRPTVANTIYETAGQSLQGPIAEQDSANAATVSASQQAKENQEANGTQAGQQLQVRPKSSHSGHYAGRPPSGAASRAPVRPGTGMAAQPNQSAAGQSTSGQEGIYESAAAALQQQHHPLVAQAAASLVPASSSALLSAALAGKTALLLTGGNGYKRISPMNNPFLSEHAHCIIWEYKL